MANQLPGDTRGIIHPRRMMEHVEFHRFPAPPELAGLVDWFWSVRWDLPMGFTHSQEVVSQPGVNISIGNAPPPSTDPPLAPHRLRTVVNGVATERSTRVLSGRGFNVAAKTSTGGFGAWVDDVRALTDEVRELGDVLPLDGDELAAGCDARTSSEVVERLAAALAQCLADRDPDRVELAREVAAIARYAETDRSVRRVEELARAAAMTPRTLQRAFASCAGVSPAWVIRRARLLDAAERVRDGISPDWSRVASELGYADQAHLTRDFTATVGRPPAAYARECAEQQR